MFCVRLYNNARPHCYVCVWQPSLVETEYGQVGWVTLWLISGEHALFFRFFVCILSVLNQGYGSSPTVGGERG